MLAQLERDAFGVTHGELGALILMLWSLPDAVVKAVAHSHAAYVPDDSVLPLPSRAVLAAEWLLDNNPTGDTPDSLLELPPDTLAQWRDMRDQVALQNLSL